MGVPQLNSDKNCCIKHKNIIYKKSKFTCCTIKTEIYKHQLFKLLLTLISTYIPEGCHSESSRLMVEFSSAANINKREEHYFCKY